LTDVDSAGAEGEQDAAARLGRRLDPVRVLAPRVGDRPSEDRRPPGGLRGRVV